MIVIGILLVLGGGGALLTQDLDGNDTIAAFVVLGLGVAAIAQSRGAFDRAGSTSVPAPQPARPQGTSHDPEPDLLPDWQPGPLPRIAVAGASGRLGRMVLERVVRAEYPTPVALTRIDEHRAVLEASGAEVRVLGEHGQPLLHCEGVVHCSPGPLRTDGLAEAARVVVVAEHGADVVRRLQPTRFAWTVICPGRLTDEPGSGRVDVGEDVVPGPISRADLADVVVAALRDRSSVRGSFGVRGL